jgi:HEAT repeat protein
MDTELSIKKIDVVRGILEICPQFSQQWVDEVLAFGLDAPDLEMKRLSCISIGRMQKSNFSPQIESLISHLDDDLRLAAIYAFSQIDVNDQLSTYQKFSHDSYEFIRELIASELRHHKHEPQAKQLLEHLSTDLVPRVRQAVSESLQSFEFQEILLRKLSMDEHPDVRKVTAKTLGTYQNDRANKLLETMIKQETDELVAIAITNALRS